MKDLKFEDDCDGTPIEFIRLDSDKSAVPTSVQLCTVDRDCCLVSSYLSLEDAARLYFWLGALLQREVSG